MSTPDNPFKPPVSSVAPSQGLGRMKKFALAVLASAIGSGLVLALIVAIAVVPDLVDSHDRPKVETEEVANPVGLRIAEHARVEDTERFTVQGVVENQGTIAWSEPFVDVTIRVSGAKVNKCGGMIFEKIQPKTRHAFQVECKETPGTNLPEGTRYDISITSAHKRNS